MSVAPIIYIKERTGKSLWLSELYLIDQIGLDEETFRKNFRFRYRLTVKPALQDKEVLPDTGAKWRYAKQGGVYYYAFANIPNDEPTYYRSMLPTLAELEATCRNEAKNAEIDALRGGVDAVFSTQYRDYLPCYREVSEPQKSRLAVACGVLELAVRQSMDAHTWKGDKLYIRLATLIADYEVHYLPSNYRRLKEKVQRCLNGEAIAEVIQLPRVGNQNRAVEVDAEVDSWLWQLRSMPQNYTHTFIMRKVEQLCAMTDKCCPSRSWMSAKLSSYYCKFMTAKQRYGSKSRKAQIYEGYIPIANALFAGDCWQMDATRVNMIAHTNGDGKDQFLFYIVVRDVHSGDILGVHCDTSESRWGYVSALKMAVAATGYLPYELVTDRFPGHNTPEWLATKQRMEAMGTKVTVSSKATGKARLERWFGTAQTVFMQSSQYYYGEGIMSRRDYAHRTEGYRLSMQRQAKKEGWDFDKAYTETMRIVDAYRTTAYSYYSRKNSHITQSPQQLHDSSDKPNVVAIDVCDQVLLFGLEKKVTIRNGGLIRTDIGKVVYTYKVDSFEVVSQHKEVILSYDLEDLSKVYIYDSSYNLLCECLEVADVQVYGTAADLAAMAREKARIAALDDVRQQELQTLKGDTELDENQLMLAHHLPKQQQEQLESQYLQSPTDYDENIDIDIAALARKQY